MGNSKKNYLIYKQNNVGIEHIRICLERPRYLVEFN